MQAGLHPEARDELRAAALWYDERRLGLGDELVDEVTATLQEIARSPLAFPIWPGTHTAKVPIRPALVKRFPDALAFETHDDGVFVLAVAHAKRRPLYWVRRGGS